MDKGRSKTRFVEDLATKAFLQWMTGSPPESAYRHGCVMEQHKPGRMIMGLPEEDREFVKILKAEDFNQRLFK